MKIQSIFCAAILSSVTPILGSDSLDIPIMQTTNMGVLVEILDIQEFDNGVVEADIRVQNDTLDTIALNETPGFTVVITSDGRQLPLVSPVNNPQLEVSSGEAVLARLSFQGSQGSPSDELTLVFNANKERDDRAPLIEFNNIDY